MKDSKKSSKIKLSELKILDPKCAGIDIGASEIFVCIAKNQSQQEVRSFPTFTADLKIMISWLRENSVESVAMESTGVYWIVPYEMLEQAGFEVYLVNARFFKNVPGRKTDVQDCQWIQQLHSYGLLRGSFRPSDEIVELRSYVRQRSRLFASAAQQMQLMHKALTQMNLQLNLVISDITGVTGFNIIRAILQGERNPTALAELSAGSCRKKKELIAKALEGNYRKEHLFALEQAYDAYEFFHKQICNCERVIEKLLPTLQRKKLFQSENNFEMPNTKKHRKKSSCNRSPYSFDAPAEIKKITIADLTTIPGIDSGIAMKLLSEIGTDMTRFPTVKAFASWLGLCPGNKISGGKILSSKTKPSDNRAAQALRMAASVLYASKTALGAFFRRLRARLGAPKAITATAHKLARILYRMLTEGINYKEAGENYYEQQYQARVFSSLEKRAEELGYKLISIN